MNLVVGTLLALFVLPLIVLFAAVLAVNLRSWPIFIQRRIGKQGREFTMVKLRTLPKSAPRYALKTEWPELRVTRFAGFLRKYHLDELPQLFLVPFGRLSLVGPRPKMPDTAERVDPHYGAARVTVPQGCTGLWQISKDKTALPHERPEYDFFYLRHRSLLLDAWVLWKTMLITLHLAKPIGLEDVPEFLLRSASAEIIALPAARLESPVLS